MAPASNSMLATDQPSLGTRARILVVDDEPGIRHLLIEILGDEGYETREADDGLSALEVLRSWTPDVILLDLSMPRMNGAQFLDARESLGLAPDVPVIVVSASRHIDERVTAQHTVLAKPFEVEGLLAMLRRTLQH